MSRSSLTGRTPSLAHPFLEPLEARELFASNLVADLGQFLSLAPPAADTEAVAPGGSDAPSDAPGTATPASWTVLVYLTASNLEPYAFADVNEMEVAASRLPGVKFAVFWDQSALGQRYPTGNGTQPAWGTAGRAVISPDVNTSRVATRFELLGEQNSGSTAALGNFVTWAVSAAPAERYALVMWDHGEGLEGSNYDNLDGVFSDHLTCPELVAALTGRPRMDLVAFDSCLMGLAEYAAALWPLTDVFVASQDTIPGEGYDYATAFSVLADAPGEVTAEALAGGMVESFARQYGSEYGGNTLAAVRTAGMADLTAALTTFAAAVSGSTAAEREVLRAAALSAFSHYPGYEEQRDLGDFVRAAAVNVFLSPALREGAAAVLAALSSVVVSQAPDTLGSSGLSVYLPAGYNSLGRITVNPSLVPDYATTFPAFTAASRWMVVLNRLAGSNAGGAFPPDWSEGNETASQAHELNRLLGAGQVYTGLSLHASGDQDWFRFSTAASAGDSLRIGLGLGDHGGTVTAELRDEAGTVLQTATTSLSGTMTWSGLPEGVRTYTLHVFATTGEVVPGYSFTIDAPAGAASDSAGGNATQEEATRVGTPAEGALFTGLSTAAGAQGWFRFTAPRLSSPRPGNVDVTVTGAGPLLVQLRDATGAVVSSAKGTGVLHLPYTQYGCAEGYTLVTYNAGASPVPFTLSFASNPAEGGNAFFRDTFTRADGPLGADWSVGGALRISGGRVFAGTNGAAMVRNFNARDVGVQAWVRLPATGNAAAGVRARYSTVGTGVYGYLGMIDRRSNVLTARIYRSLNSRLTLLAAVRISQGEGVLRLETQGRTVRLLLNGAAVVQRSDSYYLGSGKAGITGTAGTSFGDVQVTAQGPALPLANSFGARDGTPLDSSWAALSGRFTVQNRRLRAGTTAAMAVNRAVSVADVSLETRYALGWTGQYAGLVARYANVGGKKSYYLARVTRNAAGRATLEVFRSVKGAVLVRARVTNLPASGLLRFEVQGDVLRVLVDGVLRARVVDTSVRLPGVVGVQASAGVSVDDLTALPLGG